MIAQEITHKDYKNTLINNTFMTHKMNNIRLQLHNVYSNELLEKNLSTYDDDKSMKMAGTLGLLVIVGLHTVFFRTFFLVH